MIRLATVGTSWITDSLVKAVRGVPGITLQGVYSRSPENARATATKLGAQQAWSDYKQLLADPAVDALYIASPNALHYPQALEAIRAGKHVLIEKPATLTAEEFAELVGEGEEAGVVVMEAMRTAYDPGTVVLKSLLDRIGTVRLAQFDLSQRSARYDLVLAGEPVNIFNPALGGGALNDLGVYCAFLMVDLFGPPDSVVGALTELPTGADGAGSAVASYKGKTVSLTFSKISACAAPNWIQGELGTILFTDVTAPRDIHFQWLDGSRQSVDLDVPRPSLQGEVERFASLIQGGDPSPDQQRTLDALRVLEGIRRG